ncbi:MAG: SpoIIE family protein phosphatase, partial [Actinophytocola sp.]|nr:SpoIIE family protein phosphatase [Actinophytocola sp.]
SERAAATALQRSLLPARLPSVPGGELAARYVPGGEAGVGGDWYDVFTLPSGRLGVVIGDVVSHGLRAAVIMGRMRSALRAYALETEDPAVVLEKLDRETGNFEPGVMATVGFAIYDGLVERRNIPVDDGLNRLCGVLEAGSSAEGACATIMDKLLAGQDPNDDIALVILCQTSAPNPAEEE